MTQPDNSSTPLLSSPSDGHAVAPARRRALQAGVAVAAAAAGAGFAWWKFQPHESSAGADAAFWGLTFDTPAGEVLPMANLRGKPLLVNFWATWCPPCVDELPLLDRFYQANTSKNWQVLGLAVDQPSAVRNFLGKMPLTFPVGMAGLNGTDLGKSFGNVAGGLPFTVVLGSDGALKHRKMGRVSDSDLDLWLKST
ncbi:MAG: TlpA family protein disulfide reductase [Comamonadaceae bacterium]|nr:MAG: TlpA family protein disulfide reductase [Comamonadaceae bacterium]